MKQSIATPASGTGGRQPKEGATKWYKYQDIWIVFEYLKSIYLDILISGVSRYYQSHLTDSLRNGPTVLKIYRYLEIQMCWSWIIWQIITLGISCWQWCVYDSIKTNQYFGRPVFSLDLLLNSSGAMFKLSMLWWLINIRISYRCILQPFCFFWLSSVSDGVMNTTPKRQP